MFDPLLQEHDNSNRFVPAKSITYQKKSEKNSKSSIVSIAPGIVTFFTQTPGISNITNAVSGITQKRKVPIFVKQTFRNWFGQRKEVLEATGCQIVISQRSICCG